MKATELLKRQHREVASLFKGVLASEDPDERMRLANEIATKLMVHTTIEEEIFYPAFREAAETQKGEEQVLEAYEEHHVVKLLVAEIPDADASAESFEAKMTVLKELVEHHVDEEEDEMFPAAERKLGKDRLEELADELEARAGQIERDAGEASERSSRSSAGA